MFIDSQFFKTCSLIPLTSFLSSRISSSYKYIITYYKFNTYKNNLLNGKAMSLLFSSEPFIFSLCAENNRIVQPLKPFFKSARNLLPEIDSNQLSMFGILKVAAISEFLFRGIIQRILFQKIPESLIAKISPSHVHLANNLIAKIFRISITAYLFGLFHTNNWKCINGGTIPEVINGIFYGIISETGLELVGSILVHALDKYQYYDPKEDSRNTVIKNLQMK